MNVRVQSEKLADRSQYVQYAVLDLIQERISYDETKRQSMKHDK